MRAISPTALCAVLSLSVGMTFDVRAEEFELSGQIRALASFTTSNADSASALANQLSPNLIASPSHLGVLEAELHAKAKAVTAIATVQSQRQEGDTTKSTAWLNELYAAGGLGAWQFCAGKRILEWDVGYGFRPNDVVQQEKRRSLISQTLVGHPLAMVEYFTAESALALVWVNPTHTNSRDSGTEQALAARLYVRTGSADWHGFARYGQTTGASLGAATAWVATDALEVHGSIRFQKHSLGLQAEVQAPLIARQNPWQESMNSNVAQALFGATFTTEAQHMFVLEAWWDGNALSDAQWKTWRARNLALISVGKSLPQLHKEIAGNLAWQNTAFLNDANNLRRKNILARWSQQSGAWQPSLDVLWTPEDRGRVTTAALAWQGDRVHVDVGLRVYGGPKDAVFAQLPDARKFYGSATWFF